MAAPGSRNCRKLDWNAHAKHDVVSPCKSEPERGNKQPVKLLLHYCSGLGQLAQGLCFLRPLLSRVIGFNSAHADSDEWQGGEDEFSEELMIVCLVPGHPLLL